MLVEMLCAMSLDILTIFGALNVWLIVTASICGSFKLVLFAGVHKMDTLKTPRFEFGAIIEV